jgi:glycerol-3-phosphate acyltransferase PlsY
MILAAAIGYFVGCISWARIVTRMAQPGADVPEITELKLEGSDKIFNLGTISASSVSVQIGSKFGFLTYVLDVVKIAVPTLLFKFLLPEQPYFLVVAAAGVFGHVWPVFHRFKGGRGISAVYGGMFAIDWIGVFVTALAGLLFGLVICRSVITTYMAIVWFIIPWIWFRTHDPAHLIYALVVNVVFMIAMIPEIRQWLKIRREEKWNDPTELMQLSGMGRGLLKMSRKLGIIKRD